MTKWTRDEPSRNVRDGYHSAQPQRLMIVAGVETVVGGSAYRSVGNHDVALPRARDPRPHR